MSEEPFALDERLAGDTVEIALLSLCAVRLMKDARYPWVLLVPRRAGLRELHELTDEDALQLMEEIRQASRSLEALFSPDKINVGALGNIVPQLHVHVIARNSRDPAWPGPVWGVGKAEAYAPAALQEMREKLAAVLTTP